MRGQSSFTKRKTALSLFLAIVLATGMFGSFFVAPGTARAQLIVSDPILEAPLIKQSIDTSLILGQEVAQTSLDNIVVPQVTLQTTNSVKQSAFQVLKIALTNTAALALLNGVNYFAQKVAYDTANYVASGGKGQKPLFITEGIGAYLQNTAEDAAGEVFGTLSQDPTLSKYGVNLCAPSDPRVALNIKIGFLNGLPGLLGVNAPGAPRPRCSWDSISNNWQQFAKQDSATVLNQVGVMFNPGESSLSAAIELNNVTHNLISKRQQEALNGYVASSGFKDLTSKISGQVLTPADTIKKELGLSLEESWKQNDKTVAITGSAFGNAAFGILPAALQMFAGTLTEKLSRKIFEQGLISVNSLLNRQPGDTNLSFDAASPLGGRPSAELANASLLTPKILSITNYSALTDFASCPDQGRTIDNCVMDQQFFNGVSRASQGAPLTVRQAIEQGFLNRSWPLLSLAHRKNADVRCYNEAYCYSNLAKLRKARVLPIGWELAANSNFNDVNHPVTLGEAVDRFEDCPRDAAGNVQDDRLPDPLHPWCHLVDPEWVLKYPSAVCRQQAPGPDLIDSQSSARAQTCVDVASCVSEDASGNCTGGYGYCVREKSVWKLDADACPAQFASCTSYARAGGGQVSYLANTLDSGACNSQNAGCRQYSLSANAAPNAGFEDALDGQPRDWTLAAGARYHRAGLLSARGSSSVGVLVGNTARVTIASLQPSAAYALSASVLQEAEGLNGVGTVHLTFRDVNGAPIAVTSVTTCQLDPSGTGVTLGIAATHLGYLTGSCQVTTPAGTVSGTLELSSNSNVAGNRTWFDEIGLFGASFSASPYDSILLNAQAQKCAADQAGCSEFVRTSTGTLNIVRNPSFEDAQGTMPSFWNGSDPARYENGTLKGSEGASAYALGTTPISQDISGLIGGASYGFSVSTKYDGTGAAPDAQATIQLYDNSPTPQPIAPATVDGCDLSGSSMRVGLAGGADFARSTCLFTTPDDVGSVRISMRADASSGELLADAVQLELSVQATQYHNGYASSAERVFLKKAPEGIDCSGANPSPACAKYAPSCRREEVGCNSYAPTAGGTTIPAVSTSADVCPAECTGYDTFKQESTQFNASRFPLFLIPSTAVSCSAAEAGCSEFTNIERLAQGGEAREYFTYLRLCVKPDANMATFYTWEGNDTNGYQLRTWPLLRSNIAAAPATGATGSDPTGGNAPCTKIAYDASGRPACTDDATSAAAASCVKSDMAFNPDCREFYDAQGNIHYRLYTKTIVATEDCKEYRITKSTEAECRDHGGLWRNGSCSYLTLAAESRSCRSAAAGCRAYSGNASRNIRIAFNDDFEAGTTDDWTATVGGGSTSDVVNSNEAVAAGGHSLKVTRANVTKNVAAEVRRGKLYLLTFWAKGTGDLTAQFSQAGDQGFTYDNAVGADVPVALTTEWRPYQIGPVTAARDAAANEQLIIQRLGGGSALFYLDNVELREVTDDIYLVEDSWKTPTSCDRTPAGAPAPQYMLGCRAYRDHVGAIANLKSFDKLCRPEAIGCEALYDTHNSASPFPQTFSAVCTRASVCVPVPGGAPTCPCLVDGQAACQVTAGATSCTYDADDEVPVANISSNGETVRLPADGVTYLVNDPRYRCDAGNLGCTEMGDKRLTAARTAVQSWTPVYLKNLPKDYGTTLCRKNEEFCQAYTRTADGASVFFKDPDNRLCEYRSGATLSTGGINASGWFRKGTNDPCDPTFLQSGSSYGIWKNSDSAYAGWAGECSSQYDMCKEFIDPQDASSVNPKGTPYYAILNDRLDTGTCQGKVSLRQSPAAANDASACVLFWQTDDLAKTYSATATYALSDAQHGALVSTVNNGASNDSNIIIKVKRDRQCGEWLDCRSSETVFNSTSGQYQSVCTAFSLCAEFERVGNATRCVRYVDSPYAGHVLSEAAYASREVGWKGSEYSGYAIPNRYPIEELVTVNIGESAASPLMRLVRVGSVCTGAYGSVCGPTGDQGTCLGPSTSRLCVYPIDGGRRLNASSQLKQPQFQAGYPGASCRAYPQESAPFPSSVADPGGWNTDAAELNGGNPVLIGPSPAFSGANVCQRRLVNGIEVSTCECNYSIAKYGTQTKYFSSGSSDLPGGYCSGGSFDGYECDPLASGARTKTNASCCSLKENADQFGGMFSGCGDGAQCVRLSKLDHVVGYEGQCLERDLTRPINNRSDEFECATWRPVGEIGGSRDIYNQNQTAGYFASPDRRFYCVGEQKAWTTQFDINTTTHFDTDPDHNTPGVAIGPYDQYTTKFFGPGVVTNGTANANSHSQDCQTLGEGAWCVWPGMADPSYQLGYDPTDDSIVSCTSDADCHGGTQGRFCHAFPEKRTDGSAAIPSYCVQKDPPYYYLRNQAVGILGCYEVADGGTVDGTYIDYPYIGPPLYRQQLKSIYFQVADDIYDGSNPGTGEIAVGSDFTKVVTNPNQDVGDNCNSEGDDNIDNNADDGQDSAPLDDALLISEADKTSGIKGVFYLNEQDGWKVDPSNSGGAIVLSASFDGNGLLKSIRVAASDAHAEGAFGINRMGFMFKPGCEQIVQVDQPGEFGATTAFTDALNPYRNFDNIPSARSPHDVSGEEWDYGFACKPYGAIGSVSEQPPASPWTYVTARSIKDTDQCSVTDYVKGANYRLEKPEDLPNAPKQSIWGIFRKVYGVWSYAKLLFNGGGNTYDNVPLSAADDETSAVSPLTLAFRAAGGDAWQPPRVASVDAASCDSNGHCKAGQVDSISINGHQAGSVLGAEGALAVTAKFYAWASHNSMPIIQRTILWGDFTVKEPAPKGWYKNQKPFCSPDISDENAVGECSLTKGLTCDNDADCPAGNTCDKTIKNHFGNTPGACFAAPYQFDHTFTCSLKDLQAMSACQGSSDAASNAPCYRMLADAPICVYRPKVQIVDNWGWCNCTGTGCPQTRGAYKSGCSLVNPPANAKPWTEFSGEIRISPRAQDAAAFVPGGGGIHSGILDGILGGSDIFAQP